MIFAYIHCRPTGEPFYVGKGTLERANSFTPRNRHYASTVYKYGYNNVLVGKIECSSNEIAFELEKGLIKLLLAGGHGLSNCTGGGEGYEFGSVPWNKGATGIMQSWNKGIKTGPQSAELIKKRADAIRGTKHVEQTCPVCGKVGAGGSMRRWHFDNCAGLRAQHKARVTVNGVRLYLGKFHTKEEAERVMLSYYTVHDIPVPREFYRSGTGRVSPVL